MKQQVFDFVRGETAEPTIPLETNVEQELTTLVAALIVAMFRAGKETTDDGSAEFT